MAYGLSLWPLSYGLAGGRGRTAPPASALRLRRRRVVTRLHALQLRVESAVRRRDVWERGQERDVVLVDAVSERDLVALQEPGDDAELDVRDVVTEAASVGEPGVVARDVAEPVLGGRR